MNPVIKRFAIVISMIHVFTLAHAADENKSSGPPPAKVVVTDVKSGMIALEAEFVGSVYYNEVSDVASEVSGRVENVEIEEGQRVRKGDLLVNLSYDILEKTLQSTRSSYEQVLSELERAQLDFKRIQSLYELESIAEQLYDEHKFRVKSLEKRAAALRADVEKLEVELEQKSVTAPFSGIVLKKNVDRGEWLSEGSVVATIAKDDVVDIIAEVPEEVVSLLTIGMNVTIQISGQEKKGRIVAIIPRGDIATRTFPVKIRAKNTMSLMEGMEARVLLPVGKKAESFIVPRDAVLNMFGNNVVYVVLESKARMIPVKIIGYEGLTAGILAEGLQEGMSIVIKGNERLQEGQPVIVQ